jgi:hypothetical protein
MLKDKSDTALTSLFSTTQVTTHSNYISERIRRKLKISMLFSKEVASRALRVDTAKEAKREEAARYLASGKKVDVSVLMMHRVKPCGQRALAFIPTHKEPASERVSTLLTKINNYQQLRRRGRKTAAGVPAVCSALDSLALHTPGR